MGMNKLAAELRHRELTQEIYNIGDEVVEYIEHLIEAIEDWDDELAYDCLAELAEIIADARVDSGRVVGELIGLRQALISGVRAGTISASASASSQLDPPERVDSRTLEEDYPIGGHPVDVNQMVNSLQGRTTCVIDYLRELVEYTLDQTDAVARNLDMVSLPHLYNSVGAKVSDAYNGWKHTVVLDHPAYVRTMRGHNPPAFLEERARIDAVVARVAAKRAALKAANITA